MERRRRTDNSGGRRRGDWQGKQTGHHARCVCRLKNLYALSRSSNNAWSPLEPRSPATPHVIGIVRFSVQSYYASSFLNFSRTRALKNNRGAAQRRRIKNSSKQQQQSRSFYGVSQQMALERRTQVVTPRRRAVSSTSDVTRAHAPGLPTESAGRRPSTDASVSTECASQ